MRRNCQEGYCNEGRSLTHGGQIKPWSDQNHPISQLTIMWWSDQTIPPTSTIPHNSQIKPFHQSALYHMVVRSDHSTSQHCTTWWSDQTIPPVNTIPHGSHIRPFHRSTLYHMVVRSDHSTSQHHTTWWSDQTIPPVITVPHGGQIRPFHQSTPYHMVVRSKACRTVNEGQGLLPYIYLSAGPSINGDASSLMVLVHVY